MLMWPWQGTCVELGQHLHLRHLFISYDFLSWVVLI